MTDVCVNDSERDDLKWRERVRSHLEVGAWGSLADLARAIGEPERSLRRWIYDGGSARNEVRLLLEISRTFGWPLWYLMDDAQPYPPPPEMLQAYTLRQRVHPDARPHIMSIAARLVTETLNKLMRSYAELQGDLNRTLEEEARRLGLDGPPASARPAAAGEEGVE